MGTKTLLEDMENFPPERLKALFDNWRTLGDGGEFLNKTMGSVFDFNGIVHTPPTRLFEGEITVKVGNKEVKLIDLGPAHTRSDVVAYVPKDRVLFTGDLLFNGGHPAVWAGPVANWIEACDAMLAMDVDTIVPGHGPITTKQALRDLKEYFEFITKEARRHFDAGKSVDEAAREILKQPFKDWIDDERMFINVSALYRDFRGQSGQMNLATDDVMRIWNMMGTFHKEREATRSHAHDHNHAHGSHTH